MNKKKVDIRHLLKVRKRYEYEPEFNLFAIVKEVKQLYEAVCTIGLEKVDVCYEENGKMEVKKASEISPYYRAIAVVIMYLEGFELKRLEKIFGLPKEKGITFVFDEAHMTFIKEAYSVKDFFDSCFVKI